MTTITIAYGDGIGPDVMEAALLVMREAGARLEIEIIEIGKRIYGMGSDIGVLPSAWESLERTQLLLKAPAHQIEDKKNITEAICSHFDLNMGLRIIEECDAHPDISAVGYVTEGFAIYEPLQEATPHLGGKNKAHPGPMMLATAMMLDHVGQPEIAETIRIALQEALRQQPKKLRTNEFTKSVIEAMGERAISRKLAKIPA
jgi:isocitrate/isopropylmalate dehydrogenase